MSSALAPHRNGRRRENHVDHELHRFCALHRPGDRGGEVHTSTETQDTLGLAPTDSSDGGTHTGSEFQSISASRPTDNGGRGVTIMMMKPMHRLSSATRQDNRGAKPSIAVNYKDEVSLPLTGTVGEGETN